MPGHYGLEVVVAIVNYCTAELTIDCLASLAPEIASLSACKVVVADNASPDGSGRAIAAAIAARGWSDWAELIELPRNGGFSYGNNAVIRRHLEGPATARYIWLLNSDTIVKPGALGALINFMNARADVGIAGSALESPDGSLQRCAFRFHSIAGELEMAARSGPISLLLRRWQVASPPERVTRPFDWVSGASLMIRGSLISQAGLMDESYFLYFEETDFCHTARDLGWSCWLVGESSIVHLGGQSTGIHGDDRGPSRRRPQYWFESRRRYFMKHHGRSYAIAADGALALGTLIWQLRALVSRRPSHVPAYFLTDLARNCAAWPSHKKPEKSK